MCLILVYFFPSYSRLQLQSLENLTLCLLPLSKDMTQDTTKDLVLSANAVWHLSHMLPNPVRKAGFFFFFFPDPFMSIHSLFLSFLRSSLVFLFIDTVYIASFKMLPCLSTHAMHESINLIKIFMLQSLPTTYSLPLNFYLYICQFLTVFFFFFIARPVRPAVNLTQPKGQNEILCCILIFSFLIF